MERIAIFTENAVGGRTWGGQGLAPLVSVSVSMGLTTKLPAEVALGAKFGILLFCTCDKIQSF